jgi:hypothetical protein
VGTQVAIRGTGFTQDNRVRFGSGGAVHVPSYNNGTLLYFTIPSYVGPCDWVGDTSPIRCLAAAMQVGPGAYPISVENENGKTTEQNFTVTAAQDGYSFSANPQTGYRPLNVTFSTWLSAFRIPTISYRIDYGDGTSDVAASCPAPADACISPGYNYHTYTNSGTYTSRLLRYDNGAMSEVARTIVTVY